MNKTSHTDTSRPDEFLENFAKTKQVFLSFAAKIDPIDFSLLLDHFAKKSDDLFYFSQPEKDITFLSFDELTIQTFGNDEFSKIYDEIKVLQQKLISNHNEFPDIDFPIFLTCSKFPIKKISEEWKDFGEVDLIIPKISLYKNGESHFILYNLLTESFSNYENVDLYLEQEAEKIYKLESRLTKNEEKQTTISFVEESDNEISWGKNIETSIEQIKEKVIEKIVLARRLKFEIKSELNWQKIFLDLNTKYPTCTNFLIKSGDSIFFGSTPELLARFSHNHFFTEALAGSIMRGANPEEDKNLENKLLESKKNNIEHDVVTNHIKSSLKNYLEELNIEEHPVVKKFSNIQHLQTSVKGELRKGANIFDVISSLFPTPAVCGIPKEKSLQLIREIENFDRGLYSGLIGWFNCKGYGEFDVTIRSALVNKNYLYAFAGCGIVEDSDSKEEFEETKLKLKPILSLFDNAN